ncbi:MAG: hypothetical protein V1886_00415 [archaeon]
MVFEFSLAYLMTALAFILVITLVYAMLNKTKILGENSSVNFLVSFVIALIFVITPVARNYTLKATPWIAVFLVCLFLFMLVITFVHGNFEFVLKNKGFSIVLMIILLVIFVLSGANVLGYLTTKYLGIAGISLGSIRDTIFQPAVLGVLLLFVVGAVLSWFLSKK